MQFTDIRFHKQLLNEWRNMVRHDRFPQAVLLKGQDGHGALYAAVHAASDLLCDDDKCRKTIQEGNHPDLHFIYPTVPKAKSGSDTASSDYANAWREFLEQSLFGTLEDWLNYINAANKQAFIRVKDAAFIQQTAHTYPLSGVKKVFVIWHAEKMNKETANKLLKVLEEPPDHTHFILITPRPLELLSTIRSRCVPFEVPPLPARELTEALQNHGMDEATAAQLIHTTGADWNRIRRMLQEEDPYAKHKEYFVKWVRTAYMAKKKPDAINTLKEWAENLAAEPRNFQTDFLRFAMEVLRRSYMHHFLPAIFFFDFSAQNFLQEKFSPYIHAGNVEEFYRQLNQSIHSLMRNAQPKVLFMDLSVRMTRLLHTPSPHISDR